MRTIKFRAWDGKKMVVVDGLDCLRDGKPIVCVSVDGKGGLPMENIGEVPIMQFTGTLDKNGREIYEGDVVRIVKDETQKFGNTPHQEGLLFGDVASVEWNETNVRYSLFPKGELEEGDIDYYCAWTGWNWLEIIGNIYENPDLLK